MKCQEAEHLLGPGGSQGPFYTVRCCAFNNIDMAAANFITSLGVARELGAPKPPTKHTTRTMVLAVLLIWPADVIRRPAFAFGFRCAFVWELCSPLARAGLGNSASQLAVQLHRYHKTLTHLARLCGARHRGGEAGVPARQRLLLRLGTLLR